MAKFATSTKIKLTVDIKPGPVSPAQKQAWKQFWQKQASGVKRESDKDN